MAKQKADDLRQLKTDELEQQLALLTEERFRLRFRAGTEAIENPLQFRTIRRTIDRKSTRLNSSHLVISYGVVCLKKKNTTQLSIHRRLRPPHRLMLVHAF